MLFEHRVMALETLDVSFFLEHHCPEQTQERRRKAGLGIQRIKRGLVDFARSLAIAMQPPRVESDALPAVVDGGQDRVGLVSGPDLQQHAAAIAGRIIAIEFKKTIVARAGSPPCG